MDSNKKRGLLNVAIIGQGRSGRDIHGRGIFCRKPPKNTIA